MERLLYAIMKGNRTSEITETCEGVFVNASFGNNLHFVKRCDNIFQAKKLAKQFVKHTYR